MQEIKYIPVESGIVVEVTVPLNSTTKQILSRECFPTFEQAWVFVRMMGLDQKAA